MHQVCWNKHILFEHGFTLVGTRYITERTFDLELLCIQSGDVR